MHCGGRHTAASRPADERDHFWLKWNDEEGLTPATILDRWNSMTDDERKAISPRKWQKIESDGGREGARDLIEKALAQAKRERLAETGEN